MSKADAQKTQDLIEAVLALKTQDEAKRFLRDLLTEAEITEFGNRFRAAMMLSEKSPYSAIVQATGLSSTTIARVSKWLNQGENGYKTIIARLAKHHTRPHVGNGLS